MFRLSQLQHQLLWFIEEFSSPTFKRQCLTFSRSLTCQTNKEWYFWFLLLHGLHRASKSNDRKLCKTWRNQFQFSKSSEETYRRPSIFNSLPEYEFQIYYSVASCAEFSMLCAEKFKLFNHFQNIEKNSMFANPAKFIIKKFSFPIESSVECADIA